MNRFRNILVGVDLSKGDRFVAESLPAISSQAVQRSLWLAKLNGARVTFLYSVDVSEHVQELIRQSADETTVLDQSRQALSGLVEAAARHGITASFEVAYGKSWVELIRRVLTHHHDLVVIGTRDRTTLSRALFGSTGTKLLRKCPCPVWITKPSDQPSIASVLVAHDLTEVGTVAVQLGASMAELERATLHVLHSVEHPEFDHVLPARVPASAAAERAAAARSQIEAELHDFELATPPKIVLADDEPSAAILQYLEAEGIELLVMGTIGRVGISGVITGNTAEQLLPRVSCSLLAVKPEDFVSPVKLGTSTSSPSG